MTTASITLQVDEEAARIYENAPLKYSVNSPRWSACNSLRQRIPRYRYEM